MSFREKSAWITLITLVIVFEALVLATITFVVVVVVAHVIVAVRAPREASAPADERERLIGLKATRIGAYVYAALSLSSIFLIHHGANEIGLAYLVLSSFVIAEIVSCVARIVYHRRGV